MTSAEERGNSASPTQQNQALFTLNSIFAAGVNQAIIHGFPYADAPGVTWPGFAAFSPYYNGATRLELVVGASAKTARRSRMSSSGFNISRTEGLCDRMFWSCYKAMTSTASLAATHDVARCLPRNEHTLLHIDSFCGLQAMDPRHIPDGTLAVGTGSFLLAMHPSSDRREKLTWLDDTLSTFKLDRITRTKVIALLQDMPSRLLRRLSSSALMADPAPAHRRTWSGSPCPCSARIPTDSSARRRFHCV